MRSGFVLSAAALTLLAGCTYRPLRHERAEPSTPPSSRSSENLETEGLPPEEPTNAAPSPLAGDLSTFAGGERGFADGSKTQAQFDFPVGVAVDGQGNVFVSDTANNRIRKIAPDGTVETFAGTGTAGALNGPKSVAQFNHPRGLAIDDGGNVFVADTQNNKIRMVAPDGSVSTVAGSGKAGYTNAPGGRAAFGSPIGIAVGAGHTLYVSDFQNNVIRRISSSGLVTTLAGSGRAGAADGKASDATFSGPFGVATDAAGNVYVADAGNNRIRKVSTEGTVSTIAGSQNGYLDGKATDARFNTPEGIAVSADGSTIWVSDFGNSAVRRIERGRVRTLAGTQAGFGDGPTGAAKLDHPEGIAVGRNAQIFIADSNNNRIRLLKV